jgi:hypothetical protein
VAEGWVVVRCISPTTIDSPKVDVDHDATAATNMTLSFDANDVDLVFVVTAIAAPSADE